MTTRNGSFRWPSFGFFFAVGSYALLLCFLSWGFSTPPLDRIWEMLHRLERGATKTLTAREVAELGAALLRHPELADALSGSRTVDFIEPTNNKWVTLERAHLLIRPPKRGAIRISVECRGPRPVYPIVVKLVGLGAVECKKDGTHSLELPAGQPATLSIVPVEIHPARPSTPQEAPFEVRIEGNESPAEKTPS